MKSKLLGILSKPEYILKILLGIYYQIVFYLRFKKNEINLEGAVLFDYDFGIYSDFYINIYKELKKNNIPTYCLINTLNHKWSIDERFDINDFIPESVFEKFSNSIVIHATNPKTIFLKEITGIKHIQMNHGFGSFGSVFDNNFITNIDYFFANTEHQVNQLLAKEVENKIEEVNIFKVGFPKLDNNVKFDVKSINKTLFYGPTYHKDISSIFDFLDVITEHAISNDITLYIKLHPFLLFKNDFEKSGGIDWEKKIIELNNPKIILLPNDLGLDRMYSIFSETDAFITDNSALGYEFVLSTGNPIVYLGSKLKVPIGLSKDEYAQFNNCPEVYYRNIIGPTIEYPDNYMVEMSKFLESGFIEYENVIGDFRKKFTFNLGFASFQAVEIIKNILQKK